jgi:hypothetical protein
MVRTTVTLGVACALLAAMPASARDVSVASGEIEPILLEQPDVEAELQVPQAIAARRSAWLRVRVHNVGELPVELLDVEVLARFADGTDAGSIAARRPRLRRIRPGRRAVLGFRWQAPAEGVPETEPVLFFACARLVGADVDPENDCDFALRGKQRDVESLVIDDDFDERRPIWDWWQSGTGENTVSDGTAAFTVTADSHAGEYSDSEINDYRRGFERGFPWGPGVRLEIRARASDDNGLSSERGRGTRGFGFWNLGTGGPGAVDGMTNAWFLSLSPESFGGTSLFLATVFDRGQPVVFRPLATDQRRWHRYGIVWTRRGVTFAVDGRSVAASPVAPTEKLGFVSWIDNYRLTLTPDGIETTFLDLEHDQTLFVDRVRLWSIPQEIRLPPPTP